MTTITEEKDFNGTIEQDFIERYISNLKKIEEINKENKSIIKDIADLDEHKIGEIIEWTEQKTRNTGTMWNPKFEKLPAKERTAVLVDFDITIHGGYGCFKPYISKHYIFHPVTKDGGISKNNCYVKEEDIIWTGRIHEKYQKPETEESETTKE